MKKITLFASALCLGFALNAQIYSDDFESYTVGSGISVQSSQWSLWGAGAGDANIVTANANSGSNALYFESSWCRWTHQDVLMNLDQQYTDGITTISASIFVVEDAVGYFNFQSAVTPGVSWSMDCFLENGKMRVQNAGAVVLSTPIADNQWVDITFESNLSTGIWAAFIDGVLVGHWVNAINEVASVNYYPTTGCKFYIDDVSFDQTAYTQDALNASVAEISFDGILFAGVSKVPSLNVVNTGTTTITSMDLEFTYNGQTFTENQTGLSLAAGASLEIAFSPITLISGALPMTAEITNVNGGVDDNLTDNATRTVIEPLVPATGKVVVGEEGTGTWCQWCPRGDVYMNQFATDYAGYWAGVAVHNSDPMDIGEYDSSLGFTGYPGAFVDRGTVTDPSSMQGQFEARIQTAPTAFIEMGANWDATSRVLNLSVESTFQAIANSNYKVAVIITEDGVTGTGGTWNQSNAYAGGGNGPMGGYENLPNPVPASQMVYNHVARGIYPAVGGFGGSFPAAVAIGEMHNVIFEIELDNNINVDNCHIVAILIAPDGSIDNAGNATFADVVAEDYNSDGVDASSDLNVTEIGNDLAPSFELYPNPATSQVNLRINIETASELVVEVVDLNGKVMASRNYGSIQGAWDLPYETKNLDAGVYLVKVAVDGVQSTRRLVIQ